MNRTQHSFHMHTRRVALVAALLLCAAFVCGCEGFTLGGLTDSTRPAGSGLLINEVVSSNSNSLVHELVGSPDWIELYNAGSTAINLAGCHLSDNVRDPRKWEFPAISIGPGEYLILFATKYDGDLPAGVYCTGFGLSKSGESLYLTDRYLGILDSVDIPALGTDISYARNAEGRFGFCGVPTPGGANTTDIVSTLADVSYASADALLELSEVVPVNSAGLRAANGRQYPWAELYNAGDVPLRLLEFHLSDDPLNFLKWQLPDLLLQPQERLVVFFSGLKDEPDVHAGFRLSNEDSGLYLANGQGQVVSQLSWELPMVPNIAVIQAKGARYVARPTPGAPNDTDAFESLLPTEMDAGDPVILNEVLPRNKYSAMDADGDRPEWVELYNRSAQAVSLSGYALSDDAANPAKWLLPDASIAAGEYLLVFLSGKDRSEGELHASFGLSTKDEIIIFTNLQGMRQDAILLDAEIGQNISMGRDDSGEIVYFATPTPRARNDSAGFQQLGAVPRHNTGVYISEVSAVSAAKSGKADWLELHNPGSREISLAGWGLSDDAAEPYKYTIQSLSLPAGGYAKIEASSRSSKQTTITAPFGISASGDTLFLTDSEGILRDYFETGALHAGMSAGRDAGDPLGMRAFYTTPTPGAANSGAQYPGYAAAPAFSETVLYHDVPFSLVLSSATPDARIHYTLDGSKPTAESRLYTGPISVSGNTPVRAIAVADGLLNSEIQTCTYLFEAPHTLPVICLSGSQENFSSINAATERSMRVEREMHMGYYEPEGTLGIAAPCGLRASGSSTLTYAQKSFTIYFRGGYGRSEAAYPFFPGYHINAFKSLTIRNGGQDRSNARLRDSYYSLLVEGMYIDNVATRPVIVYINGSYWGLYDLNENQNEDFLAGHYGVDPDRVDIIRRNVQALAGSNRDNKRVRAFGHGENLGDQSKFDEFAQWVDIDYITDYLIAQTFFANGDMFNQKYWRSEDYTVKWRPVFYDLDYGFFHNNSSRNILPSYFKYEGVPSQDGSLTNMDLYCGLPANAAWREQFVKRYAYIVEKHLNAERMAAMLDAHVDAMRPEMERHIKKWRYPSSVSAWESNVKQLRNTLLERPEIALKLVRQYFDISESEMEQYRQEARAMPGLEGA